MFTPPILPDHPLYLFGMLSDRIDLLFASREQQFALCLKYANIRLITAQALLRRGRTMLALTTATKAEKYILLAAQGIQYLPNEKKEEAKRKLAETISLHKEQLMTMKPFFSDAQKATIDSLIEQVLIIKTTP